ncbi:beta-ketoacyl synthase N-terminal-like domain-containing protein [Massilia sp. CCM 9210]|uniref:beta-ketoacyl synthase N-terminal-like domain-containing protein n=1 Tax=Massilia scottii TaxID=3057166 RepID=UPI002796D912|nr:beta-ketoacyl synthase N-terminal-like domain-containing protein [Massilia sp. CCM 9210]MDQ1812392.1 beta-ketoacyl synthase N-terminal-like domain-containing protein [Massilia sp. CCM 9210]
MKNPSRSDLVVSGIGVTSAIGQGREAFLAALMAGRHRFDTLRRPGRQRPNGADSQATPGFLGAEIGELTMPDAIPRSLLRTASLSGQVALVTLHEAWNDAALGEVAPERVGLIVGGSNVQQRELTLAHDNYRGREQFLRPTYGMSFMDSDLCGMCTEVFGIRGFAYTVGGASASGQLAVIEAMRAVESGRVDVCIAVGALMDLSYWECQGFRSLGAMGSTLYASEPALACRPFDRDRDGFIFGESCGAVVVERADAARRTERAPYARLTGWAMAMDAHRNPNPSVEGEMKAIKGALACAGLTPADIDYINPHGTGSPIGDITELESIRECRLGHAWLNATKSVIGHGLTAAGCVELIAVMLQMKEGRLHPTRNLDNPMETAMKWVGKEAVSHSIDNALNLSMGFGGVNTAVCLQRYS